MPQKVDFYLFNELFLNLGAVNSPSELQGVLCGRLAGGAMMSAEDWLALAVEFADIGHVRLSDEQTSQIQELLQETARLLADVNYTFAPLLPGDEATIDRRAEELGLWCQGFLHGLGCSGLKGEAQLSPNVAEALRDLAQISQVSVDSDDDLEENEGYWLELVEYVKVAVLTVHTELVDNTTDKNNVVH